MKDTVEKVNYFPALTGVRAIAAYMVYLYHYNPFWGMENRMRYFIDELHTGVTFFFVLSGFLIAQRYFNSKVSFKEYIFLRIARIFPLFITILIGYKFYEVVVFDYPIKRELINFMLNITLIKGFSTTYIFSGVPQAWSLSVEELFYLFAPFAFFLIKRNSVYLIVLPLLLMGIGLLIYWIFQFHPFYGFFDTLDLIFNFTFFGRCSEFFIGIGLYLILSKIKARRTYFTYIGLIGSFLCILWMSYLRGHNVLGVKSTMGIIINTLILPLVGIAPLYLGLMKEKTLLSRILSSKLFQLLGKSSYAFYLVHLGFIYIFMHQFNLNPWIEFIIIQLLSIGLFLYLEEPIHRKLRSLIMKKTKLPA